VKRKAKRQPVARVCEADHVLGSPLAAVTLIGYGNFTNPGSTQSYRTVKKIRRRMGRRLRYVFRSFPESPEFAGSERAAEAAECASSQGKFWEMHDCLFENPGASDELDLSRHAVSLGLDMKRFRSEMRKHAHRASIRSGRREGARSGVLETPAFFINSRRYRSAFGLATLLPAVQAAAGGD
jgi:formate-nitrite transporter family protein